MLLGALVGAGVPVEVLQDAIDAVAPEPIALRVEDVRRGGLAATRVHVDVADSHHHRTWRDVRGAARPAHDLALAVFERLAVAEAAVHGTTPDEVHFHEVGALDAIADVVGVCAGFAHLGADARHGLPRRRRLRHGPDRPRHAPGPAAGGRRAAARRPDVRRARCRMELCTPTGAALLTTLATAWGPQPAMTVDTIGVGAGGRDPEGHANVLRLFVGPRRPYRLDHRDGPLLLECNVDDLDPRVWPAVIAALLEAGASDAWLTPILMKKGRPAHTLSVLVDAARAADVRATIFRQTSTIGLREQPVAKHALEREFASVEVGGQTDQRQARPPRRGRRQRPAGVRRRRAGRRRARPPGGRRARRGRGPVA